MLAVLIAVFLASRLSADRARNSVGICVSTKLLFLYLSACILKTMGLYWYLRFQSHIIEFSLASRLFLFIVFFSSNRNPALIIYYFFTSSIHAKQFKFFTHFSPHPWRKTFGYVEDNISWNNTATQKDTLRNITSSSMLPHFLSPFYLEKIWKVFYPISAIRKCQPKKFYFW